MSTKLCWLWLVFATAASQAETYMCSNTFRAINTGDATEVVAAACGMPAQVSSRNAQTQTPALVARWVYTLDLDNPTILSSVLTSIAISFQNERVVQIEKNGLLAAAVDPILCVNGGRVQVGDDATSVIRACGAPAYTADQQMLLNTPTSVLVWTYNFGPSRPQAILEFENNKLMRIQNGPLGN